MPMKLSTMAATLAVLLTGTAWGGDTRPPVTHPRPAPAKAAPAARPALTDAQMEAAIRARFSKSKIGADKFQVHVQGGVATIEGRTDVVQHKGTATRIARSAGAVAVNNRVQPSEAARQKASENLAKGRRRAQIKRGDARTDARSSAK
jgi:hypothetical protein